MIAIYGDSTTQLNVLVSALRLRGRSISSHKRLKEEELLKISTVSLFATQNLGLDLEGVSSRDNIFCSFFPTSSDFAHGGDGRVVWRDATQGFRLYRRIARNPQHQSEQALVPTEGLLGQLATW